VLRKYRPVSDYIIPFGKLTLFSLTPRNSNGFGPIEGPYPEWHMPKKVRWMVAPEASVKVNAEVKSDTSCVLHIRVLTQAVPQSLKVLLNETTILEKAIDSTNKWHAFSTQRLKLRAGENILKFCASAFKRYSASSSNLYVLFDVMEFKSD